ncbi:hypothetical protein [Amycolatopsis balhimycina]|uniref:hypothetical protein n=1 Tax=Amycolatopsis balhimycina TaxID=208443 RepID=UPI0003A6F19D|nr:hypothetical protein [Amycolatopsis balhimycina]
MDESRVDMAYEDRDGCVVVHPDGVLDALTYRELRDRLVKLAVGVPRAVIADIGDLQIPSESGHRHRSRRLNRAPATAGKWESGKVQRGRMNHDGARRWCPRTAPWVSAGEL